MNLISDILFWISNGLLVPVVVLLIILFIRSLLLIGSFFGQYLAIRRTDALLRQQLDTLTIDTLPELEGKLPVKCISVGCWGQKTVRHMCSVCWLILKLLLIRIWLFQKH